MPQNSWNVPYGLLLEVATAFVRSVAGGNETVPNVETGSQALVNPRSAGCSS